MDTVERIGVLDKTVAILHAVEREPCTLRRLVEVTGITRPTAHRLAVAMEAAGLLRRDEQGAFTPGVALISLGRAAAESFPLAARARPALAALSAETGESCQLYVVDDGARLCVAAVESTQELRTIVGVGARLPLDVGSAARILAPAGDEPSREWVASVAERAPGVASVSAAVRRAGEVVAAVSISGPIDRMTEDPGARFGDAVVAAARTIERALG